MADDDEILRRLDYVERAIRRLETSIEGLRDLIRADIASRPAGARPKTMPAAQARYRRARFPDGPHGEMIAGWEMWAGDGAGWVRVHGSPPADAIEEPNRQ